ncbi:hypothetical protein GGI04_002613 [Coemansia thaxteri]|uniref:Uncharacterized protein n=1 Tax=Coemansia thaxteri TaxID=2663907 RepID=A0A9W8BFT3_9FUNG|nr:hypothetical protein H4R26_002797 [Coemansia thaxteri]KAJ2004401.1 hypothetical protein GGI04_002613 [Coemansia thaxteri]KAJ2470465.1 hypothetical protein GGI02_002906 [Coemansia sp. RSA 2322]KAJ2480720.1 hypothetical protein EV174_003650 [Coemansia sp. RSA 2320]
MKVARYLSFLATGLSLLVATATGVSANGDAAGQQGKLVKRLATSAITGQKGAILLKNGNPTSCEVALISNLLGYVAANCLQYSSDGSVDMSPNYQVMISNGTTLSMGMFSVYSATAHFKYDPATYANNIALIKFNAGAPRQFKNYIAANRNDWSTTFFVSRAVTNGTQHAWIPTQVATPGNDVTGQCANASPLFASNMNDLICTSQTTVSTSTNGGSCALPYSSIYGIHDPDLAIAGLYSHSVIVGESLCKYTQIYHYYILLSNYLEWGGDVAKSTIYLYVADMTYVNNNNPNYSMVISGGSSSIGSIVVGGDLSGNSPNPTLPTSSATPTSTTSQPTATTTKASSSATATNTSSASSSGQNSTSGGMNIGIILLIIGIILLILAIIAYLLYRRYKKRREQRQMDLMEMNSDYGRGAQDFIRASYGTDKSAFNGGKHLNTRINLRSDQERHSEY